MAQEVRTFQVTVPANTPSSAPQTFDISFPPRPVRQIEWMVPPGPRGNVGFQLGLAGTPLIPYNRDAWIIANGDTRQWNLEGVPDSGAWQVRAYNTGSFPHTLYFRFLLDLPVQGAQGFPAPIAAAVLES